MRPFNCEKLSDQRLHNIFLINFSMGVRMYMDGRYMHLL